MVAIDPPDWLDDTDRQDRLTAQAERLESYFGTHDYSLDAIDIGGTIDNERAVGRYNGRGEDGTVDIELVEDCNLDWDWFHELGHDAASELVLDDIQKQPLLLRRTFDETFAYLTGMTVREDDRARPERRDIFSGGTPGAWKTLRHAVDPQPRDTEAYYLDLLDEPLTAGDWSTVSDIAQELEAVPPDTGTHALPFHTDELYQENIFLANLPAGEITEQKRALKDLAMMRSQFQDTARVGDLTLEDMVADAYLEAHENDYPVQTAIGTAARDMIAEADLQLPEPPEDGGLAAYMDEMQQHREAFLRDNAAAIVEQAIQETAGELERSLDRYSAELEDIEDTVDYVLDAIQDEEYGDTVEGIPTGYDEYVDIPHRLGTELAETCYQLAIEPQDLVEDPETYMDVTADAVRYTIRAWLDPGHSHSREDLVEATGLGDPDDLGDPHPSYSMDAIYEKAAELHHETRQEREQ